MGFLEDLSKKYFNIYANFCDSVFVDIINGIKKSQYNIDI